MIITIPDLETSGTTTITTVQSSAVGNTWTTVTSTPAETVDTWNGIVWSENDSQFVAAANERTMVSSDGSPTMRHPRGYGSFTKIIETYVLEKFLFSLEEAIYKMTGLTAQTLGVDPLFLLKTLENKVRVEKTMLNLKFEVYD